MQPSTCRFSTILEALAHRALSTPDQVVYTWVDINCKVQRTLTFQQLEDESNAVAAKLLKLGCKKGDRVMVAYPFGLEFLAGMFGAMKISVIPCSIYPPNPNQLKTDMPKFRGFVEDAGAKFALSSSTFATAMTAASVLYKTGVRWIGTDKLSTKKQSKPKEYETHVGEPSDIAFIQYTSGSTGRPKGVMISHRNLAENCKAISSMSGTTESNAASTVAALWVPQYHDMGLVAGFMTSLYTGIHLVMASPLDFVARPLLWTDMIEGYQANLTCAPNFAYALLLKRLQQANRTANWSSIRRAMFGGEPAQSHVVEAVSKTLSIRPEHVYNIYGLAESVVYLTGGSAYPDSEGLLCCGEVDSNTVKLRIAQEGKQVEDGQVGSIWAQSPRVAAGYYGQQELTASTFANRLPGYEGTWLDTGDLGKIVDGQLYVTGRVKDVIIINGKNYYPTDVELSIDEDFGNVIRPGRTTAFQHGEDSIGITAEGRKGFDKVANEDLALKIANHVSHRHGLFVSEVVVLKLGVTPKTTSGKLKRSEIKRTTIDGNWDESSVLLQLQRQQTASPSNNKPKRPSFLERSFSMKGIASSNSYLQEGTQREIIRRSMRQLNLDDTDITEELDESSTTRNDTSRDFSRLISSVFGSDLDQSKTWSENGLTSLKSAELRSKVEEDFHVTLPTNFEQLYPTPAALSDFLDTSKGASFPKQDIGIQEFEWNTSRSKLSKLRLGVLQALGSIVIFMLLLASVVPSYVLVTWFMEECGSADVEGCHDPKYWIPLPLVFPLVLLSFSVIVVFSKYLVVGKYRPQQFDLLSWDYLQWWFVDRLMEVWESLVGQFFVETKYIWIFYWLMGADLAWSAKIESYIREFELVRVGENATIGHPIKCRKFSQADEENPKVSFRPIVVGKNCHVSGMVSPGSIIGNDSKVEKLSAVEEGAVLPSGVLAKGVPAYRSASYSPSESNQLENSMLDAFKIVWTICEAYHFFSLSFLVHTALNHILPSWRYATILHWILLVPASSFLALLTSIFLKWILIGKRDPSDEYEGSLYRRATNWACDFHFRVAAWTLTPFFGQSRLWNIILFLHGLNVDMASGLNNPYLIFFPSKVDFVKIRNSFVATISLDFRYQADSKIEIINSSVGYNVNLHAGVKIMRSAIPPRSDVTESVYDLNQSVKRRQPKVLIDMLFPEMWQLLLNVIIFASIIPSYEIGIAVLQSASIVTVGCGLAAAFALQLFVWILLTRVVEWIQLGLLPGHLQQSFFGTYINHVWIFGVGNWLVFLLYGTPMFASYARMMGAQVDGDLWYFGNALYEYGRLHFRGSSTIVDSAHVSGHYIDSTGLTIDHTHVSGVLHPGCYASAGSVVAGGHHGPWKVFLRSEVTKDSSFTPPSSDSAFEA